MAMSLLTDKIRKHFNNKINRTKDVNLLQLQSFQKDTFSSKILFLPPNNVLIDAHSKG